MKMIVSIVISLLSLHAAVVTPEIAWRFSPGCALSPPFVYEMLVFVGSCDSRIYALYAHSGKIRWSKQLDGGILAHVVCEGRTFVSTSEGIFCLDADNGDLLWKFEMKNLVRRPIVVGNNAIFAVSHEGRVLSLGFDGSLRWEENLNEIVVAQPTLLGDSLVLATLEGRLIFLEISSGTRRRTISLGRFSPVIFDLMIAENIAYLCSDNLLFALSVDSGEILWMRELNCATNPLVFREGILIGTPTDLIFLEKETGEILWSVKTGEMPFVVTSDTETILVGTKTGLEKYDANGVLVWKMNVGAVTYPPVLSYEKIFVLVSQKEILCIGNWGEAGETGKEMGYVYLAVAIVCGFMLALLDVFLQEKRVVKRRKVVKRKPGGVAGI